MSTTMPGPASPATPLPPPSSQDAQTSQAVLRNGYIAVAVLAPIAMFLPPRKLDLRFFLLSGAFSFATDQLVQQYTGEGIYARVGKRFQSVGDASTATFGMPEGARRTQQLLREEKARRAALDDKERAKFEQWQRDRQAIEEGKGLTGILMDEISEAFGRKKKSDDGDNTSDGSKKA